MLHAAVIGTGNMGKNHARIYSELPDIELVAICDINEETGASLAKKYGCKFYNDYKELIKNEQIDIVSIAVPTTKHKDVAIEFLNNKKHVLVEKPISDTLENAQAIISAAKVNNVKLLIGHIERYNPGVLKVKELIKKGEFGDIISINAKRVGGYPAQIKDSNVVVDVAIHDVDILNFLYERQPEKIFSSKGSAFKEGKTDYVDILLNYGGKSGSIQCNWVTPTKIRTLTVTGTKAYAELNYITQELKVFYSEIIESTDDFGDFIVKFGNPKVTEIDVQKEEPLKLELENFIDAVNGKADLKMTPEEALKALAIVLKVLNSET